MSRRRNSDRTRGKYSEDGVTYIGSKPASGFKPRKLTARTPNQAEYIHALGSNSITLCSGPAGTGKTHVAVGFAVTLLKKNVVEKIILCRPIVDAGESIGYLPGDVNDKVGPYLTPLFDELSFYLEGKFLKHLQATGKLEVTALAQMRGRTFTNAVVILDESQNATKGQLKMFLTRIGAGTHMVLTGDIHQSDLPISAQGGFESAMKRLDGVPGIAVVRLGAEDIVRHPLISEIEKRL